MSVSYSQRGGSWQNRMAILVLGVVAFVASSGARADDKSAADYAQQGLIGHWDGYENAGRLMHDSAATTWKDLTGKHEDMVFPNGPNIGECYYDMVGATDDAGGYISDAADIATAINKDYSCTVEIVCDFRSQVSEGTLFALLAGNSIDQRLLWLRSSPSGTGTGCLSYGEYNSSAWYATPNVDNKVWNCIRTYAFKCGSDSCAIFKDGVALNKTMANKKLSDVDVSTAWLSIGRRRNAGSVSAPVADTKVYAVRIYARELTDVEIAANAAVDVQRFVNGQYKRGGLLVTGRPEGVGEANPGYGRYFPVDGETFVCAAPANWTNEEENVRAALRGWEFALADGTVTSGIGQTKTIVYSADAEGSILTWLWARQYKVSVAATVGGGVSKAAEWVADGDSFTVTAMPEVGRLFSYWCDTAGRPVSHEPTLTLPVKAPMSLTAVFGEALHVGTESGDYKTIDAALAVANDGDTIIIRKGTYTAAAQYSVTNAIAIRGVTGKPEDVVIKASGKHRVFRLENMTASISDLTVQDGKGESGAGVYIASAGGSLFNVVVRNCEANALGTNGGGIYIAAPNDESVLSLVDSCVVSNCTAHCEFGGGNGIRMNGGVVRNSLVVFNKPNRAIAASNKSGAVYLTDGELINCTIAGNSSAYGATGVYVDGTTASVRNCVIVENTLTGSPTPTAQSWQGTASCFANSICSIFVNDACMIEEHPFADSAHGNYTLSMKSAAIDGAEEEPWMLGSADLLGNSRISGSKPDIGAIEYQQGGLAVEYVVDVASGLAPLVVTFTATTVGERGNLTYFWDLDGNGSFETETTEPTLTHTYTDPCVPTVGLKVVDDGTTPAAEAEAEVRTTIRAFGEKIYVSAASENPSEPYDNWSNAAVDLESALSIACDGCEVVVSNGTYDVAAQQQISSGITVRGVTGKPEDVVIKASGKHGVFRLENMTASISDLTVQDGKGESGAGVYIASAGGSLFNVVVRNCEANVYGANGGGIYIAAPNDESVLSLVDSCVVSNCTAHCELGGGNGIRMNGGVVRNSLVVFNKPNRVNGSSNKSGAVYLTDGELINCTIAGNSSTYGATGVYVDSTTASVRNCVIVENTLTGSPTPTAQSWQGTASCFANSICSIFVNDTCMIEEHPFADSAHGDYTPSVKSAAFDGAEEEPWMLGSADLLGNSRISGSKPDIGAIEYQQGGLAVEYVVDVASGLAPLVVTFTATTVGERGNLTYFWDLDGNGSFETETTEPTLTHTYTDPCVPTVGLKVVDDGTTPAAEAEAEVRTTIRAFGEKIYVSAASENPSEPYDNWSNAAVDLESALSIACDGCEVVVSNGTYDVAAQQQISSGITVRGLTGDWRDVVIRSKSGSGDHRIFLLNHAESRLEGLTISGGRGESGAGVYISDFGGMLYRCAITNCSCSGVYLQSGGGVFVASGANSAIVDSCIITGCNSYGIDGAGGAAVSISNGRAVNCIITGNEHNNTWVDSCYCGTVRVTGGTFAHSVVVNNGSSVCPGVWATGGVVVNCIIGGNTTKQPTKYNTCWAGDGLCFSNCIMDIEAPVPCTCQIEAVTTATFKNYEAGDYRLRASSKAIHGGVYQEWMEGTVDIRGRARSKHPDCGAYECSNGLVLTIR